VSVPEIRQLLAMLMLTQWANRVQTLQFSTWKRHHQAPGKKSHYETPDKFATRFTNNL